MVVRTPSDRSIRQADKVLELDRKVELYQDLMRHPAWELLTQELHKQRDKIVREHVRAALDTGTLNEVQLAYDRGFCEGMDQLIRNPLEARATLDAALKRLNTLRAMEGDEA